MKNIISTLILAILLVLLAFQQYEISEDTKLITTLSQSVNNLADAVKNNIDSIKMLSEASSTNSESITKLGLALVRR